LLRHVVYQLLKYKYLDQNKSIIDIGCWLADNSLVWARLLTDSGIVHAIDPSAENISFGQRVACLNAIQNINWVQAVCSDKPGISLAYAGEISHTQFFENDKGLSNAVKSATLDEVVNNSEHTEISLIHLDVEGFEEKVLRGAENIILKNHPVILYEQHIASEDTSRILNYLCNLNYSVSLINEVLPGCDLDCRNFIAFHNSRPVPELGAIDFSNPALEGVIPATIGGVLVPVN
jgi:FkbM family methyltransferase